MKKRYARILAATLSAAMVFTSAPVNFTGIDLGVIEAEAAAKDYNSINAAVQACEAILNTVKWSVKYSEFAADDDTIQDQVNAAIAEKVTDLSDAGFAVTATPVTTGDGTKTPNDAKNNASYAFKITATWTNTTGTETLQLANRNFKVEKDAPAADFADFNTATADYVIGTITNQSTATAVLGQLSNTKNAQGDTVVAAANDYDIVADSLTGLKAVNVAGTVYDLTFRKFVDDADVVDYASLSDFKTQGGAAGYFEKVIKVTVKGSVATVIAPVPGEITYDFGDSKVKLTSTTDTNYKVVGYINEDLPNVAAGTLNVKLEAKATTDVKAVDIAETLKDLQRGADATTNAWKSTWSFDYATNKFNVIMPMPAATTRVLNIKDIVWPTKLKDGTTTVPYLTQLSTVELEETATSKAGLGKFVLVYHKDDTHTDAKKEGISDPSFKKYCIQFVPTDTKVVVKNPIVGGIDHYGAGDIVIASSGAALATDGTTYNVAIEKKNALAVTTSKSVIATKDIAATYKGVDDDTKYGTTYANIAASVTFPQASLTAGTYTLKDAKASDLLKPGKNTITYVYKVNDSDRYEIEGGTATKEVSFDVTVKQPVLKAVVAPTGGNSNFVKVGATNKTVLVATYAFDNVRAGFAYLNPATDLKITKYQWSSENKGEIFNATLATYTVNATEVMTDGFSCAITGEVKSGVDAAKAEMYKTLLGNGTLVSDPLKVYVTNMDVTRVPANGTLANQTFGAVNATASARIGLDAGFTMKSVTWTLENKETKEKVEVAGKIAANNTISCDVPKDTQVGKYKMSATIVAASASEEQTAVVDYEIEVTKATLAGGSDEVKLLAKINVAEADKSVKYGTKLKDIKLAIPAGSEKFGTYQWLNGETYVSSEEATYTARFIANDFARRNYKNWDTVGGDVKVAGTQNYGITGIKATKKAELVIKADDIVVEIGKAVPEGTYTTTGLVGTDTVASLGLVVKVEADKTVADLTKVGTYTGAAVVSAKHGEKTNENINDLENYEVKVVAGNVIVKAAAPVVTPTPTPAPVKQATAAAPKAAKAKATVKVGKKYTLKLKYAAGKKATVKKVTWKSSKKSVATVSSKGKVTAKKAGKATIAATITFKDGSKKKVKFTVTVK